jgi:hypothetical protein
MLDFIQFINDNAALMTEQKVALLSDFCEQYSYQEFVDDGQGGQMPNPVGKQEFANAKITDYLEQSVNATRIRRAKEAVSWEELVLE